MNMRKIYRKCKKTGCRETILQPEIYCEKHKGDNHKAYNEHRKKHNYEYVKFYGSNDWKRVRKKAMQRDNYLCQMCFKNGVIKSAELVHHIIETKNDWSKRLDMNNLLCICNECHERIHNRNENR